MRESKQYKRFLELVAALTALRVFNPQLPPTETLLTLGQRYRRRLCQALDLMESTVSLRDDQYGELCGLLDALPKEWPANLGSFVRQLHEVVHGLAPTNKVFKEGHMQLEEISHAKTVH